MIAKHENYSMSNQPDHDEQGFSLLQRIQRSQFWGRGENSYFLPVQVLNYPKNTSIPVLERYV
jgi:hypothetical protein